MLQLRNQPDDKKLRTIGCGKFRCGISSVARKGQTVCFAVWPTPWGAMGAVAGRALRRVMLPHYRMDDLLAVLQWENPGALRDERPFEKLIGLTCKYFNGRHADFSEMNCELPPQGSFAGKVLRACRSIPYGRTQSYGELARRIGQPGSARAVGAAMGRNPIPLVIPCHRVIGSDGRMGGFSAPGGVELKRRMLAMERSCQGGQ